MNLSDPSAPLPLCPICKKDDLRRTATEIYCANCDSYRRRFSLLQIVTNWAAGRTWWWRTIVVMYVGFLLAQNLRDSSFALNRIGSPFSALDFGIHELGHILFIPFGEFMTILGGSLFQCLFPLLWFVAAWRKRWYFGAAFCIGWLGLNMFDVATYAADARARLLSLATLSSDYDSAHDWYQILSRTGHLEWDHTIAQLLRTGASFAMVISLTLMTLLIILIIRARRPSELRTLPKNL